MSNSVISLFKQCLLLSTLSKFSITRIKQNAVTVICGLFATVIGIMLPAHAQTLDPPIIWTTGGFGQSQQVTMTVSAADLSQNAQTIFYSTDGSIPSQASNRFSSAITVTSATQIKAVAWSYQLSAYSPVTTQYVEFPALWLRADTGVTTTGTPPQVTTWTDTSGSGNSATGVSGSQPVLNNKAVNSLPAISFNGSSQFLSLPAGFPSSSGSPNFDNGVSIFVVALPSALTPGARIIDLGDGTSSNSIHMQVSASGSYGEFWIYNNGSGTCARSQSPLALNQYQLIEAVLAPGTSSASATFYLNGVPGVQNTSMNNIPVVTLTSNYLAQATTSSNFFQGNIAEVIVYPSANAPRQAIEAYLMQKYQLLSQAPPPPVIGVPGGFLSGPAQVAIFSQPGSITRVTTDGTTPTSSSTAYSGSPIFINYSQTLKAISFMNGLQSDPATAVYTLDPNLWPAPNPNDTSTPNINLQLPTPTE